jgi:hypothetical protein
MLFPILQPSQVTPGIVFLLLHKCCNSLACALKTGKDDERLEQIKRHEMSNMERRNLGEDDNMGVFNSHAWERE